MDIIAECQSTPTNYATLSPLVALVAQLDRAPVYETGGRKFESCRARHSTHPNTTFKLFSGACLRKEPGDLRDHRPQVQLIHRVTAIDSHRIGAIVLGPSGRLE